MKRNHLLLLLLVTAGAYSPGSYAQVAPFPQEGRWRGIFTLGGRQAPFNFELEGKSAATARVYLLNGTERVALGNLTQKGDSLFVPIDVYDAQLALRIGKDQLSGVLRSLAKPDAGLPLTAEYGKTFRFSETKEKPRADLTGKWELPIISPAGDTNRTVGVFEQTGTRLTGTILTTTGDYRYLEGNVQGDRFYLSAFSGAMPLLVEGLIAPDGTLTGELVFGRGTSRFSARKNPNAALPDPNGLTSLKEGYQGLDFTFPDLNGKPVSLKDPKYRDKVVIVTILGSWCPNCVDETAFLAPWYRQNRHRGVEIIGLAFERKDDPAYARYILGKLIKRFDVQYDILFAGRASKEVASDALPALSKVLAFPTTILIDRKGNVQRIHTGYTGPATGKYYEEYVREFNEDVDRLLHNEPLKVVARRTEK